MDRELLRAQDATLLCAQDDGAPLQIGALCLFEAAPLRVDGRLRVDELTSHIESRLQQLTRFRRRLEPVPFGLVPPVWVDDDRFDITHHVRRTALPEPGDEEQLRACLARIVEQPLDPTRPLWELWLVEGVDADRVGLVLKCSHVMADGMALLDFALSLLDASPDAAPAVDPQPAPQPRPAPAPLSLLAGSVVGRTRRRFGLAWRSLQVLRDPVGTIATATDLLRSGAAGSSRALAPRLSINRPVGPHRGVTWRSASMPELLETAHALGVPLNDVVLAIVAGALRRYLGDQGAAVDTIRPRVIVPISIHGAVPGQEIENRFSMMVAEIPVDVADPVERVRVVHREMVRLKSSAVRPLVPHLFEISDLVPVGLLHAVAPALLRRQPLVNLAVTNLPGTPDPMYLLGSPMTEVYPFISLTGNIALIIGVLSYQDRLGVGITVDADVITDVDALARAFDDATRELVEQVADPAPAAPGG